MLHKAIPDREHLAQAKALEAEGEIDAAMEIYQRILKNDPLNETAVGRSLVLYRRQKAYKQELALLKAAISAYEAEQLAGQEAWRKKHQKAARISLALARKLGGAAQSGGVSENGGGKKKAAPIYDDRLATVWRKRKAVVTRRLKDSQGLRPVGAAKGKVAAGGKVTAKGKVAVRGKVTAKDKVTAGGKGTAKGKVAVRGKTPTGDKTKTRRGLAGG